MGESNYLLDEEAGKRGRVSPRLLCPYLWENYQFSSPFILLALLFLKLNFIFVYFFDSLLSLL